MEVDEQVREENDDVTNAVDRLLSKVRPKIDSDSLGALENLVKICAETKALADSLQAC